MVSKLKTVMLSGAALTLLGTSAMAADYMPAPVNDWTGFYFGVGGGGAFNFSETDASGYGYASLWADQFDAPPAFFEFDDFGGGSLGCSEDCEFGLAGASSIGGGSLGMAALEMLEEIVGEGGGPLGSAGDNDTGKANAFGTVEGGFDYQVGSNFLIGVNAAFNFGSVSIQNSAASAGYSDISVDLAGEGRGNLSGGGSTASLLETDLELGNSWSIGARAGYLVSDSILLFASGGYVSTKAELKASYALEGDAGVGLFCCEFGEGYAGVSASSSNDEWLNGYYLGGGVETLLTESVSFKLEYRFSDLGSIETSASNSWQGESTDGAYGEGWAGAGVSAEANPIVHAIRATVNWRF